MPVTIEVSKSPPEPAPKIKVTLQADTSEAAALADRAKRLKRTGKLELDELTSAVQFLRGVRSRSVMALPAFYRFVGSNVTERGACFLPDMPGTVLTHWTRFSSVSTITLACRKAFDHAGKGGLYGGVFAKRSDDLLQRLAGYWGKRSSRQEAEAWQALLLLREVFRECSRSIPDLLENGSTLGKRVGLLKQHANQEAAHLSLETYEFSILDCAHVVGALTLVGEIIRSFDEPGSGGDYFNRLDEASLAAAKAVFPKTLDLRLFDHINIGNQASYCWKRDLEVGKQMLFEQLPYAMSWF